MLFTSNFSVLDSPGSSEACVVTIRERGVTITKYFDPRTHFKSQHLKPGGILFRFILNLIRLGCQDSAWSHEAN